jgi:phosphatidate cytidylyltransferase
MLKYRVITAVILITFVLLAIFYLPPQAFLVLTALFFFAAAWEWTNLMGVKKLLPRIIYLLSNVFLFFMALWIPAPLILLIALVWWVLAAFVVIFYPRGAACWHHIAVTSLIGWLVLLPCWMAINFVYSQDNGVALLLFLFVLIWGADSAAYFVGRKWGKTKLAPQVSPGKSVAGLIGAVLFALIFSLAIFGITNMPIALWPYGILLALITVLFSILGDLFESAMKRQAGVKDSGKLLPGHGGILDRIDSLTAAAPIFVLGWFVIGLLLS